MLEYLKADFTEWTDPADPIDERVFYSYATQDESSTYYKPDLSRTTTWDGYADDRIKYLIMASRRIDEHNFIGEKTDPDQLGEWPRRGIDGVDENTIPPEIERATIILAYTIALNPSAATISNARDANIKTQKVGTLEIEFFHPISIGQESLTLKHVDNHAYRLISKFLNAPSKSSGQYCSTNDSDFYDRDFNQTYPYGGVPGSLGRVF